MPKQQVVLVTDKGEVNLPDHSGARDNINYSDPRIKSPAYGATGARNGWGGGSWYDRAPVWANGEPFYCACGCDGPYYECEQPDSAPEPIEEAQQRRARWILQQEFDTRHQSCAKKGGMCQCSSNDECIYTVKE